MSAANLLLDPNVAYVVLVFGFVLAILALFTPGTGLLEFGALAAIVFAGYAIISLPFNVWALVILLVGVIPFILAVRKSRQWVFLALAILALLVGSIFLFRLPNGTLAVSPLLAGVVSVAVVPLLWIIGRRSLEAMARHVRQPMDGLVGRIGEARTDIGREGTAYVGGEEWSAHSKTPISTGAPVRVTAREGFTLEVEPVKPGE